MPSTIMRYPVEPFRPRGQQSKMPASQPQEMQNGNGHAVHPPSASNRQPPSRPPVVNGSDAYVQYNMQQNGNAEYWPCQLNDHWAPGMNEFNNFPPSTNRQGYPSFMDGWPAFRPHTAPLPELMWPGAPSQWRSNQSSPLAPFPSPSLFDKGGEGFYPDGHPYQAIEFSQIPPPAMPPPPRWMHPAQPHYMRTAKFDDPEAKIFVGDLPVRMTTDQLYHALKETFSPFGECKINVIWTTKRGPGGVERSLPTGWIQYKTVFDAAKALDIDKESGFVIGNRAVRVDRADGKRICRIWPSIPCARPSLVEFKNVVVQFIKYLRDPYGYHMMYHVSNGIDMVEKNYGGRLYTVPSIGVLFRRVEDASYAQSKFATFTSHFKLKIEHVDCGTPKWRQGPVSLELLNVLLLDTGEKWQEELIRSRRGLRERNVEFPLGKLARYPERIGKKLIPRSILEHPRLKKDVFGFKDAEWLDIHQEPPTSLAMANSSRKTTQTNSYSNCGSTGKANGDHSHASQKINGEYRSQVNGKASNQTNGEAIHQKNHESNHRETGGSEHQENDGTNDQPNGA
ncbi:conserved hypothetical protein [Talaromyces stipitatus ATCC 10500]|uniref:RRM domain-containing protein n=1 Tax=Talaromyces stipitatus (strain ATCC 10500 / CBS 375.48 / QM 6759 / NRRL 1006) TaxID=441959 RepID=B8MND6_TALSN|nr:uncharacterized protein TSTA_102560 [Talaromyces stipitatus ATCC 10500]EED14025.1 conserved hypothetical protein [Talaromyces stipitatus ATCC 10500]